MTPNKYFNSYKEGLDLEFLREYCMEHGKRRVIERGEMLEETGELSRMIGLFNLQPRTIFDARFKLLLQIRKFLIQEYANMKKREEENYL